MKNKLKIFLILSAFLNMACEEVKDENLDQISCQFEGQEIIPLTNDPNQNFHIQSQGQSSNILSSNCSDYVVGNPVKYTITELRRDFNTLYITLRGKNTTVQLNNNIIIEDMKSKEIMDCQVDIIYSGFIDDENNELVINYKVSRRGLRLFCESL